MTKNIKTEHQKPEIKKSKKSYVRPQLVEYGDVAKLTASGGSLVPHDAMSNMAG
jgi:hypothetical protein